MSFSIWSWNKQRKLEFSALSLICLYNAYACWVIAPYPSISHDLVLFHDEAYTCL